MKDRVLKVAIPAPVFEWLTREADRNFTSVANLVRHELVQRYNADVAPAARARVDAASSARAMRVRVASADAAPAPADATHAATDTATASTANARTASTRSGYKGVYAYGKRWAAVAYARGQRLRLGVWDTAEEAARAYDQYLIAQNGDPHAAVNFPHELDELRSASAPFIEQFAARGHLSDIEWEKWQRATHGSSFDPAASPLPVLPPSAAKISPTDPLVDRPARVLYKRPVDGR
ncbi:MAG: AP2 domain-containing protein [Candidatus Sigynarchaeota archaeon]|jgi:hypothetical protein